MRLLWRQRGKSLSILLLPHTIDENTRKLLPQYQRTTAANSSAPYLNLARVQPRLMGGCQRMRGEP